MRGFPKAIGSKQDLENLLAMPEHAEAARGKLAELEAARMVWVPTKLVEGAKPGITDETNQVVELEVDGKIVRQQMKLREDLTAAFVRLGLADLMAETDLTGETPEPLGVQDVK